MIQLPCSDGAFEAPGQICAITKAMQRANDAGQLWARHCIAKFHSSGWTTVPCEPATFVINHRKEWTRLIAKTNDFAVSASSQSYLNIFRVPFEKSGKSPSNNSPPKTQSYKTPGSKFNIFLTAAFLCQIPGPSIKCYKHTDFKIATPPSHRTLTDMACQI
jgi:hypothetical protein